MRVIKHFTAFFIEFNVLKSSLFLTQCQTFQPQHAIDLSEEKYTVNCLKIYYDLKQLQRHLRSFVI